MLISVIIPVYNGEPYLAQAIDSVLQQSWQELELIVSDDGSTDGTAAIARSYGDRLRYHRQENQGQGAARNAAIAMASGEAVAFLDADDLWVPDKLALQAAALQENNVDMVFGMMENFHSPELSEERRCELTDDGEILAGYSSGTMLVRLASLLKAGLFPTHVRTGEFLDWYARAQEAGLTHLMLDQVLLRRRLHNRNFGIIHKNSRHEYIRVLKDALDRRRKGQ